MSLTVKHIALKGSSILSTNDPLQYTFVDANAMTSGNYYGHSLALTRVAGDKIAVGCDLSSRMSTHVMTTTTRANPSLLRGYQNAAMNNTLSADVGTMTPNTVVDANRIRELRNEFLTGINKQTMRIAIEGLHVASDIERIDIGGTWDGGNTTTHTYAANYLLSVTQYPTPTDSSIPYTLFVFDSTLLPTYVDYYSNRFANTSTYTVKLHLSRTDIQVYNIANYDMSPTPAVLSPLLTSPNNDYGSMFGKSVSISDAGDRILIGAPYSNAIIVLNSPGTIESGMVYVSTWNGSVWSTSIANTSGTPTIGGHFGEKVAGSSDCLLYAASEPDRNNGEVHVYRHNGSAYLLKSVMVPGGLGTAARFGENIAMNTTGSRIAVGAPDDTGGGKIYMYDEPTTDTWVLEDTLTPPNPSYSKFGGLNKFSMSGDGTKLAVASEKIYVYTRQIGGNWTYISLPMPLKPTFSAVVPKTPSSFNSVAMSSDGNTIVASADEYFVEANNFVTGLTSDTFATTMVAGKFTNVTAPLGAAQTQTCGSMATQGDGTFTVSSPSSLSVDTFGSSTYFDIYNAMHVDSQGQLDNASAIELKFHGIRLSIDVIESVSITGIFGSVVRTTSPLFEPASYTLDPLRTTFLSNTGVSDDGGKSTAIRFSYQYVDKTAQAPLGGTVFRWTFDNNVTPTPDTKVNLFVPGQTYVVSVKLNTFLQGKTYVYHYENGSWRIKKERHPRNYGNSTNNFGLTNSITNDGKILVTSDYKNSEVYMLTTLATNPMADVSGYTGDAQYPRDIPTVGLNRIYMSWPRSPGGQIFINDVSRNYFNVTENCSICPNLLFGVTEVSQALTAGVEIGSFKDIVLHSSTSVRNQNGVGYDYVSFSGMQLIPYTGTLNTQGYYLKTFGTPSQENGRNVWFLSNTNGQPSTENISSLDHQTLRGYNIRKISTGPYSTFGYSDSFVLELYGNHLGNPISLVSIKGVWDSSGEKTRQSTTVPHMTLLSDAYGSYTEFVFDASTFSNYSGYMGFDILYRHYYINFENALVNATTTANVAHSMGTQPDFYMTKCKDLGSWFMWHKDLPANTYLNDLPSTGLISATVSTPNSTNIITNQSALQNTKGREYVTYAVSNSVYADIGSYSGSLSSVVINTIETPVLMFVKPRNAVGDWSMLYIKDGNAGQAYRRFMSSVSAVYLSTNTFGSNTVTISEADPLINAVGQSFMYVIFSGKKTV